MNNAELISIVKKPGKVLMPVLAPHGVTHVMVMKSDLINELRLLDPEAPSAWAPSLVANGCTFLDVQEVR